MANIKVVWKKKPCKPTVIYIFIDIPNTTSLMVINNLSFSKWDQICKDPMTTAATIDRLVHHNIVLELNLPSYRLEHSKKAKWKKE